MNKYVAVGIGWEGFLDNEIGATADNAFVKFTEFHHRRPELILTEKEYRDGKKRLLVR